MSDELEKAVKDAEDELSERFWNVKVWPLGITKWEYTVGFFVMGIISLVLLPILLYIVYFME